MTKKKNKPISGKNIKIGLKGRVDIVKKKRIRSKKKSIHANTFEERQENIRKKQEAAQRKKIKKDTRAKSHMVTRDILSDVKSWVIDNPIHPSTVPLPTQLSVSHIGAQRKFPKTYKAFIRNLPADVSGEEIDNHFKKANVNCTYIRILVHRITNKCLGWGFLEFHDRLNFEKALTLNVSRFRNDRILVEGSLRSFVPSKKRPQKLLSYKPVAKNFIAQEDIDIMEIDDS